MERDRSMLFLVVITVFFSLANSITGIFLPNYYLQAGLDVGAIILLMAATFLTIGLLPLLLLKLMPESFEKLLIVGIILTAAFYALLLLVKNPLLLGLVQGLSLGTYWPAFNLLLYRHTSIRRRGLVVSLLYVAIPAITTVAGPAMGGVFISILGFGALFALGIAFLAVALAFSLWIRY